MYANTNGKGHIEMINKHMKYDPCHYDIRENQNTKQHPVLVQIGSSCIAHPLLVQVQNGRVTLEVFHKTVTW
jgi:hypothetical protein